MPWSSPLPEPIRLRNGRVLRTLHDVGEMIAGLDAGRQRHAWNEYAAEMLRKAADDDDMIEAATMQVRRALGREGIL